MYQVNKRVSNILDKLKASSDLIPQIILIGKDSTDADSKNKWVISETYYIKGKYINNKLYVDDYTSYLDNIHQIEKQKNINGASVVIVDDLDYCR